MTSADIDMATYGRLTGLIYAAVFDPARWQDFLDELNTATGGVRTHLFGYDIPADLSLGLTASGYAQEFIDSYNDYYGALNSWAPGFAKGEAGVVLPSQWMCPKEDLFNTEFYNDWIRPQENVAAGGGALIFKDPTRMIAFGGNIRMRDEEKLEASWLKTVGLMIPHLRQAFEISRAMSGQSLELDLLNRHAIGRGSAILLLADNGFLLHANPTAERMLRHGDLLRDDKSGRVSFQEAGASSMLGECLRRLRAGDETVSARFDCGPPGAGFDCRAVKFSPEDHAVSPIPLLLGYYRPALLVIVSQVPQDVPDTDAFLRRHGLTDAEIAVATGIAAGLTPAELSDQRGVSVHTVRNQLKAAMHKTGCRRQTDLVRLIEASRTDRPAD